MRHEKYEYVSQGGHFVNKRQQQQQLQQAVQQQLQLQQQLQQVQLALRLSARFDLLNLIQA